MNLLDDIVVIDFSQFLSGPSAGLRLADMGARVIKVERRGSGDICRELYVSDVVVEGESTIFHAINRNKESFAADLKEENDLQLVKELLKEADVLLHNYRPGVMERLGLDYETVKQLNPSIVYAEISGYGTEGPWKDLPGQDLLLQSVSGLAWLSNDNHRQPTPMGVAVADIMAGTHLAQGILAALYQTAVNGEGAMVQVNMLESILDFQFEVLTCFYNDGNELPVRSAVNNGHAYIAAPYGIYQTSDGFLALAMGDILVLADLLDCPALKAFPDKKEWFGRRDEIKQVLVDHLKTRATGDWLRILEPADIWCAKVLNYDELVLEDGYQVLDMEVTVSTSSGLQITTTRCPIRVDGRLLLSYRGAPRLGEHNQKIEEEFLASAEDFKSEK
jgi:crotonobetainyl-CoA:carnitine CoA-transferase CaiB-like acyl-CoA transferase